MTRVGSSVQGSSSQSILNQTQVTVNIINVPFYQLPVISFALPVVSRNQIVV